MAGAKVLYFDDPSAAAEVVVASLRMADFAVEHAPSLDALAGLLERHDAATPGVDALVLDLSADDSRARRVESLIARFARLRALPTVVLIRPDQRAPEGERVMALKRPITSPALVRLLRHALRPAGYIPSEASAPLVLPAPSQPRPPKLVPSPMPEPVQVEARPAPRRLWWAAALLVLAGGVAFAAVGSPRDDTAVSASERAPAGAVTPEPSRPEPAAVSGAPGSSLQPLTGEDPPARPKPPPIEASLATPSVGSVALAPAESDPPDASEGADANANEEAIVAPEAPPSKPPTQAGASKTPRVRPGRRPGRRRRPREADTGGPTPEAQTPAVVDPPAPVDKPRAKPAPADPLDSLPETNPYKRGG